jgi:hypothetical protein
VGEFPGAPAPDPAVTRPRCGSAPGSPLLVQLSFPPDAMTSTIACNVEPPRPAISILVCGGNLRLGIVCTLPGVGHSPRRGSIGHRGGRAIWNHIPMGAGALHSRSPQVGIVPNAMRPCSLSRREGRTPSMASVRMMGRKYAVAASARGASEKWPRELLRRHCGSSCMIGSSSPAQMERGLSSRRAAFSRSRGCECGHWDAHASPQLSGE